MNVQTDIRFLSYVQHGEDRHLENWRCFYSAIIIWVGSWNIYLDSYTKIVLWIPSSDVAIIIVFVITSLHTLPFSTGSKIDCSLSTLQLIPVCTYAFPFLLFLLIFYNGCLHLVMLICVFFSFWWLHVCCYLTVWCTVSREVVSSEYVCFLFLSTYWHMILSSQNGHLKLIENFGNKCFISITKLLCRCNSFVIQ
jgi:hypothetical protein